MLRRDRTAWALRPAWPYPKALPGTRRSEITPTPWLHLWPGPDSGYTSKGAVVPGLQDQHSLPQTSERACRKGSELRDALADTVEGAEEGKGEARASRI